MDDSFKFPNGLVKSNDDAICNEWNRGHMNAVHIYTIFLLSQIF